MADVLSLPMSPALGLSSNRNLFTSSQLSLASQLSSSTVRHHCATVEPPSWPLIDNPPTLAPQIAMTHLHAAQLNRASSPVLSTVSSASDSTQANESFPDKSEPDGSNDMCKNTVNKCTRDSVDNIEPSPSLEVPKHEFPYLGSTGTTRNSPLDTLQLNGSVFRRWLGSLKRRRIEPVPKLSASRWLDGTISRHSAHPKSSSISSSVGFLAAVKSASMTLAGTSIAPASKYGRRNHLHSDNTSVGFAGPRLSMESTTPSIEPTIDGKAWYRSIQRRNIIEEILKSEESYISDMKAMIHVYSTLLASTATISPRRKDSIRRSVTQIVQLHQELLAELQQVVPVRSSITNERSPRHQRQLPKHTRWHSADTVCTSPRNAVYRRRYRNSMDMGRSASLVANSMAVTTNTVLNVAKVFERFMKQFLAYEAYVTHREMLHQEAAITTRLVPAWTAYERGVEALNASTTTIEQRESYSRKGLTLSDLGIKPIQRICKYPLFFSDLCKQTPACDDPLVHTELEKVLSQFQETLEEIDQAMDNTQTRHLVETTWLLQERLAPLDLLADTNRTVTRHLGRVVLCGALYIAYESSDKVKGHYAICILYRSSLVLATMSNGSTSYQVEAIIPLHGASIAEPDNGRGLQCYTAPYTWKLIFVHQQNLMEFIMSACSEQEEMVWRHQLQLRIATEAQDPLGNQQDRADPKSFLTLNVKPDTFTSEANVPTRRQSIRRAATLGPKTQLRQVIIKNTYAQTAGQNDLDKQNQVTRSKSHMSPTHIPTLAPRRSERVRLEGLLADVWSRDFLPYPGMATRRSENTIRASANSVMRKLSMASIASNFSRRSASFSGSNGEQLVDMRAPSQSAFYNTMSRSRRIEKRKSRAPMVDFHSAPAAFLPEDFELKKTTLAMRGQNIVKRAMTLEGPGPHLPENVPLRSAIPAHRHSASVSFAIGLKAPAPTPLQSEALEQSSSENQATTTRTDAASQSMTVPAKVKGKLFKLLGVKD